MHKQTLILFSPLRVFSALAVGIILQFGDVSNAFSDTASPVTVPQAKIFFTRDKPEPVIVDEKKTVRRRIVRHTRIVLPQPRPTRPGEAGFRLVTASGHPDIVLVSSITQQTPDHIPSVADAKFPVSDNNLITSGVKIQAVATPKVIAQTPHQTLSARLAGEVATLKVLLAKEKKRADNLAQELVAMKKKVDGLVRAALKKTAAKPVPVKDNNKPKPLNTAGASLPITPQSATRSIAVVSKPAEGPVTFSKLSVIDKKEPVKFTLPEAEGPVTFSKLSVIDKKEPVKFTLPEKETTSLSSVSVETAGTITTPLPKGTVSHKAPALINSTNTLTEATKSLDKPIKIKNIKTAPGSLKVLNEPAASPAKTVEVAPTKSILPANKVKQPVQTARLSDSPPVKAPQVQALEPVITPAPDNEANPKINAETSRPGTELASLDPASLLPFPRINPRPRLSPKVPKGPLYIKKPIQNDALRVFVFGDSLASGLWQGLHQNFRGSAAPNLEIVKKAKANTGIVRNDRFDWMRHTEQIAGQGGFEIAVMMFGANDSQTIRQNGKRYHFKTPGWEQAYRQRIDRIVHALKKKGVAIYWVGLPNVRIQSLRKNYRHFNEIYKEKALEHGLRFIDTWDVSNDTNGNYRASGRTLNGKTAKLRAKDGTHFTSVGYRLLASFPEKIIRPDIAAARASRFAKGLRLRRSDG